MNFGVELSEMPPVIARLIGSLRAAVRKISAGLWALLVPGLSTPTVLGGFAIDVLRVIEFKVKATGKILRDEQLHLWTLNDRGQVVAFRHYLDTAKHIEASTP